MSSHFIDYIPGSLPTTHPHKIHRTEGLSQSRFLYAKEVSIQLGERS